jgi:hypothetical protein
MAKERKPRLPDLIGPYGDSIRLTRLSPQRRQAP